MQVMALLSETVKKVTSEQLQLQALQVSWLSKGMGCAPLLVPAAFLGTRAIHACQSPYLLASPLQAWLLFVRTLSAQAPQLLARLGVQAAVVLLPMLEGPEAVVDAAAKVGDQSATASICRRVLMQGVCTL
jgi:hypothetical protein